MNDTKLKLLEVASYLTQERGFGGFSYQDLAAEVGIKTSSIHYYFRSKDDLAVALVEYTHELHDEIFQNFQESILYPKDRLEALIDFFQNYITEKKFCLCGMLVAELNSVSGDVRNKLNKYFSYFQTWLAQQFDEIGSNDSNNQAMAFLTTLEGALLIARVRNDPNVVKKMLTNHL